jgi:hypothetical protein
VASPDSESAAVSALDTPPKAWPARQEVRPALFKPPPPPLGPSPNPSRAACACSRAATTGIKLAAAAHDLRFSSTFDPSQHNHELQDVALHLLSPSPSPAQHQSAASALDPSRPP